MADRTWESIKNHTRKLSAALRSPKKTEQKNNFEERTQPISLNLDGHTLIYQNGLWLQGIIHNDMKSERTETGKISNSLKSPLETRS